MTSLHLHIHGGQVKSEETIELYCVVLPNFVVSAVFVVFLLFILFQ